VAKGTWADDEVVIGVIDADRALDDATTGAPTAIGQVQPS
jgi:hypothetical protein